MNDKAYTQLHTRLETFYSLPRGQGLEMIPFMDRMNPVLATDQRIIRLECLQMMNRDFHKLLSANEHDYWMYMLNDNSLKCCLESFFRLFPRPFDTAYHASDAPKSEQREEGKIYRRIFMIYYRLFSNFFLHSKGTDEEGTIPTQLNDVNEEEWLDVGSVIYQRNLFDVPKLFDLSSLYGYSNTMLATELLSKIFLSQPTYMHDLNDHILNTICVNWRDLFDAIPKLPTNQKSTSLHVKKLIYYLYDSTFSIRSLLDVFPLASYAFMMDSRETKTPQSYQFSNLLLECHDRVIHQLMNIVGEDSDSLFMCRQIKLNIVSISHVLFREYYMRNIEDLVTGSTHTNHSKSQHADTLFDRYFESIFTKEQIPRTKLEQLCKYTLDNQLTRQSTAIVLEFLDTLQNYCKSSFKDQPKLNLLLFQYNKLYGLTMWLEQIVVNESSLINVQSIQTISKFILDKLNESTQPSETIQEGEEIPSEALKQLKSFFPDFGVGFLQACLDYFKNDLTSTTNALMDNQLPAHIKKLDTKLTLQQKNALDFAVTGSSTTKHKPPTSLIETAQTYSNVGIHTPTSPVVSPSVWMDTDFFSQVRIGKKKDNRTNFNDIDETLQKRILLEYAYDDEYDDSYDNIVAGIGEGEHEDENFNKVKAKLDKHEEHHKSEKQQPIVHKQQQPKKSQPTQQPSQKQQAATGQVRSEQQLAAQEQQAQRGGGSSNRGGGQRGGARGGGRGGRGYHHGSSTAAASTPSHGSTQDDHHQTISDGNNQPENNSDRKFKGENKAKVANHDRKKRGAKKRMNL